MNYAMSVTRLPAWNDDDEDDDDDKKQNPSSKSGAFRKNVKKYYKTAMHTLTTMLDFSILSSPSFVVLTISGFLTLMGFFVPFMYISGKYCALRERKTGGVLPRIHQYNHVRIDNKYAVLIDPFENRAKTMAIKPITMYYRRRC